MKQPTGIPKSMLMQSTDGSYALSSGAVKVLKPNEDAFEREIEGLPSPNRSVGIRDHIISKSMFVCWAMNVLADDLLPNKTVRDTINRILEMGASNTGNSGSAYQVQDMESARDPYPKIPSFTMSSASKGDEKPQPIKTNKALTSEVQVSGAPPPQQQISSDKGKIIPKIPDVSEASHE